VEASVGACTSTSGTTGSQTAIAKSQRLRAPCTEVKARTRSMASDLSLASFVLNKTAATAIAKVPTESRVLYPLIANNGNISNNGSNNGTSTNNGNSRISNNNNLSNNFSTITGKYLHRSSLTLSTPSLSLSPSLSLPLSPTLPPCFYVYLSI
jgi:hypothetical protein